MISEASAKIREGIPIDDKEDMDLNIRAGVLQLITIPGQADRDPELKNNINLPVYISKYNY